MVSNESVALNNNAAISNAALIVALRHLEMSSNPETKKVIEDAIKNANGAKSEKVILCLAMHLIFFFE